ncbi:hypothetical protein F2Q69_00043720 [Brassica cretica]|uniref:Uncharacterized protein n=1 Tax=Brassica cretica TaxID=69181 RepID=A0A8S9NHT1_BRACR|nr:hypothetical protein F2Q69_00043720 [Brassica cretica]
MVKAYAISTIDNGKDVDTVDNRDIDDIELRLEKNREKSGVLTTDSDALSSPQPSFEDTTKPMLLHKFDFPCHNILEAGENYKQQP